jgi:hypothetical protein
MKHGKVELPKFMRSQHGEMIEILPGGVFYIPQGTIGGLVLGIPQQQRWLHSQQPEQQE